MFGESQYEHAKKYSIPQDKEFRRGRQERRMERIRHGGVPATYDLHSVM